MKYKKIISKVLVIGLCLSNISVYSFASDINVKQMKSSEVGMWTTSSPMPLPKINFCTEVVGEKIYVIGGVVNPNGLDGEEEVTNSVEVYDPSTDKWESGKTPMPTARSLFETIAINEKIYCIGGELSDGSLTNVVEVYDTINDTWDTSKAPMPIANSGFSTVLLEEKFYTLGGTASDGMSPMYNSNIYEYDFINDSWDSTGVIYPDGRAYFTAEALGERIYYMGGMLAFGYEDSVYAYDFNINNPPRHVFLENMPTTRGYLDSVLVEEKIYCIGGKNDDGAVNVVEVYDTTNDTWDTSITPMPTDRYGFSAEYINGKIYCMGGYDNSGNMQSVVDVYALKSSVPTIESNTISNNADVYIKMANTLSLSLDTSIVTFEDFSGVEDMEKKNAINLTVESSLPYEVNASLETEIQNLEGTNIVDKGVLGIKSNTESNYNVFTGIQTPIILLDNQQAGQINVHGIDLKLNKNIISKADVYKTTLKFEVKQK